MIVIGLLGGVASGKSLVAAQLAELGAVVLDADRVGHEVLLEPDTRSALRARFGDEIFDAAGAVSRPALAQRVFAAPPDGPAALAWLESLTHPRIGAKLRQELERLRRENVPAVALDAPVMLKAGWDRACDLILFVEAPFEARAKRAGRRGWTPEQLAAREAAQESLEYKRARADIIIDNSGTPEQTRARVRALWRRHVAPLPDETP